jgi:hypothetical protein
MLDKNLELANYLPSKRTASRNLFMINKRQQLIMWSDVVSKTKKCRGQYE